MEREQVILIASSASAPALASDLHSTFLPKYADSPENIQLLLQNPLHDVRGMFVVCDKDNTDFIAMVQLGISTCPGLPMYLIDTHQTLKQLGVDKTSISRMGISGVFEQSIDFVGMTRVLDPLLKEFEKPAGLSTMITESHQDFIPIHARHFLSGSEAMFDIFVKLSADKFVKISQAGQKIEAKRISNYIKKGVETFYLKKESQRAYINYCDFVATNIRLSQSLPDALKVSQSLHLGDQISGLVESGVLDSEQLNMAAGFVEAVNELATRIAPKGSPAFNAFLNDISTYSHGVAVTMLSVVIAREFEFEDLAIAERVGLAAMFHDLGMKLLPEPLRDKTVAQMSDEELQQYHSHPVLGADELEGIPYVHESVIEGVRYHHVRKDDSGFPEDVPFSEASLVAQIVGISDEIVHAIEECKRNESDLQEFFEISTAPGFSNHLTKTVHSVLFRFKNQM